MLVRDVMAKTPTTIAPEAPVETAVAAEPGGRLRALTATLNDVRVNHVMTWRVVTIGPQAPVAQAAAIMANVRVGSLPVVEGRRLVGIVTEARRPQGAGRDAAVHQGRRSRHISVVNPRGARR